MKTLSIVIPAHNEADNLSSLTAEVAQALTPLQVDYEMIVVDDGSADRTAAVTEELSHRLPLRLIRHQQNQGYGQALRSGFAASTAQYLAFIDGDGQLNPADFKKLLQIAEPHSVICGYRSPRVDHWSRVMLGKLFSRAFVPLFFGLQLRDVDCALKIFPRWVFERVELVSKGALVNAELLSLCKSLGLDFVQVPVSHRARLHGESSGASPRVLFKVASELVNVLTSVWDQKAKLGRATAPHWQVP